MALKILTPPPYSMMPVTPQEAMEQARIEEAESEVQVVRLIHAVTDWLAGRNGWLGRSIMKQTLQLTLPLPIHEGFTGPFIAARGQSNHRDGASGIVLPRPPIIAVTKVEVLDGAADPTVIAADSYSTFEGSDGLTRITFQPDYRWPVIARGPAYLRITYDAGYGETPVDVDEGLRHAILMTVARLYDDRGQVMNQVYHEDPMIKALFANYRIYTV